MANTTVGADASRVYDDTHDRAYAPSFPPAWAVPLAAAALFDDADSARLTGLQTVPEGPSWYVTIAPGSIRVGHVDLARQQRAEERAGNVWRRGYAQTAQQCVRGVDGTWRDDQSPAGIGAHAKLHELQMAWVRGEAVRHAAGVMAAAGLITPEMVPEAVAEPLGRFPSRARITEWSRKSRANMLRRFSTLDYEPLFGAGRAPAMVTMTLPREWREVAPTGRVFKQLVRRFAEAYSRAWSHRMAGLWKLEFQERGAPHLHVLMVTPTGTADGLSWPQWFARTWTTICMKSLTQTRDSAGVLLDVAAPSAVRRTVGEIRAGMIAVHEHRKASQDYTEGLRASDPKRIAVYFLKHALKPSKSKEYQHIVPEQWHGEGEGPGRFWGYWQLARSDRAVPVTADQAIAISRTLRRWSHAQRPLRQTRPVRIDTRTGLVRSRSVTRRIRFMPGTSGFMLVNDGPAVGLMLAKLVRT